MSRIKVRETIASPLSFRDPFRLPYVLALVTYAFRQGIRKRGRNWEFLCAMRIKWPSQGKKLSRGRYARLLEVFKKLPGNLISIRNIHWIISGIIWFIIVQETSFKNICAFSFGIAYIVRSVPRRHSSPRVSNHLRQVVWDNGRRKKKGVFAWRDTLPYTNARRRTLLPLSPFNRDLDSRRKNEP